MRVVLSVDMEGVSQLVAPNEIIACCEEYWATGKPRLEDDVAAACRGLLAGGADEVVVLDNHASGNTYNVWPDALPSGARLEEWNVFDLPAHRIDAMLQVGYHARGDVDGFLSHTYVPGLRLRAGEEPISESHGRAWAAGVPLLGIVGNDRHAETLGSLDGTPFLVVQESRGRGAATPVFAEPEAGLEAIEEFALCCVRERGAIAPVTPPREISLAASKPNGTEGVAELLKNELAAYLASRLNSNALPVNRLLPEGVTIRTELAPPADSAPDTDVVIVNSATVSEVGRFGRKSSELIRMKLSWMLMPSSVT